MIIWIASYPKSGNTWIRALITSYLYSDMGEFNFNLLRQIPKFTQEKFISPIVNLEELKKDPLKISEYWKSAQSRINLDNQTKFLKTHNACISYQSKWFTDESNSMGYIYIVRDPRAVVCSLASHAKISMEKAVDDLINPNQVGYNGPHNLAEISSSWKINYLSWKKEKKFKGIVVKYEDLIDNTEREFRKILIYLKKIKKIEIEDERIKKTILSCHFSNLSKMENDNGFEESTDAKFFRKGRKDSWKKDLNKNLIQKIEKNFKVEMTELGYL